jgi:DNA polymerase I
MSAKKLFLIDAHALIYRAHYALVKRPLINSQGLNVSAIYGFMNTILDILHKENPSHLIVAFDLEGLTFRHHLFTEYKAGREAQPEDIRAAIPIIKQLLAAFPIQIATCEGYEADDVVGTLAKQAEQADFQVFMVSPDKDYAQLVSENIFLLKPAHFGNEISQLGVKEVLENWEIKQISQVIDFLALQGDAVDNIAGVKGIGKKTAQQLLSEFDSVEDIYNNLDKIKLSTRQLLVVNRDNAFLSKTLATIDINVPIKFDENSSAISEWNKEQLLILFKQYEFRALTERFLKLYSQKFANKSKLSDNTQNGQNETNTQTDLFGNIIEQVYIAPKTNIEEAQMAANNIYNSPHVYKIAQTAQECQNLVEMLLKQSSFAFDTETTGLDAHQDELVGLSFSFVEREGYYIPLPKNREEVINILNIFKPAFEAAHILKIGQNLKFDMLFLRQYGFKLVGKIADTMLMHYILEPEKRHNLDYLSETYLGYSPVSIETLIGKKGKNQLSMRDIPLEKIAEYAAEDADLAFRLYNYFDKKLTGRQRELYDTVEIPLVAVLVAIEANGVKIDADFLNNYALVLNKDLKEMEKAIFELSGSPFNLNSPSQVGEILFARLKIPYRWKKTSKTGQYSTDEEKMSELADDYPIIQQILAYRQLAKLQSTYVEALPLLVKAKTGRVHSSFNQALTVTGRLSSQNPNLQNIPIRSDKGKEIRKAFVAADKNHILVAADYSQIELRLLAAMSQDVAMVSAFRDNLDIHTATASLIFNTPLSEVSKKQRYAAKTVNFSIIYGAGASNLSRQLDIKRSEALELIENYYKQYSGLKTFMDSTVEKAKENNYVETLCGRRRYLRDLHSNNSLMRTHAERNAVNTPIQGTAADMIKLAMINIHNAFEQANLKTKMILQVHDELLFDVPLEELATVLPIIENLMKTAIPNLSVPIEISVDKGQNWLEAH